MKVGNNRRNKGGAAYNIVNLDYEQTYEGLELEKVDYERAIRQKIRLKQLDYLNSVGYNPINGSERLKIEVPLHYKYNPPDNPITGA